MTQITLLNTSILTGGEGTYSLIATNASVARGQVKRHGFVSAIGHESTAAILSSILEVDVPVNRIQYEMKPSDRALVFKVHGRPPEGKILTAEEIEALGYSFFWLVMEEQIEVCLAHNPVNVGDGWTVLGKHPLSRFDIALKRAYNSALALDGMLPPEVKPYPGMLVFMAYGNRLPFAGFERRGEGEEAEARFGTFGFAPTLAFGDVKPSETPVGKKIVAARLGGGEAL